MLETLTAQELLVTYKTRQVGTMFVDSLVNHNVVAFNAIAEDLKRRGEQAIFSNLVYKAFEDGFTAKFDDTIVDSLRIVMSGVKEYHPLNMAIWAYLEKNRSKGELFLRGDFYDEIGKKMDEIYDKFCSALPAYDVASMDEQLFNILIEHYAESVGCPNIEDGIMDREHEIKMRTRSAAEYILRTKLSRQIDEIRTNDILVSMMKPVIKRALCTQS